MSVRQAIHRMTVDEYIRTVHDLVTLSEQDLRELKGFGSKALDEVKDKLAELEL